MLVLAFHFQDGVDALLASRSWTNRILVEPTAVSQNARQARIGLWDLDNGEKKAPLLA